MADFAPGDVVVCVDDDPCTTPGCGGSYGIAVGRIYQVERTYDLPEWTGLTLKGVNIGELHLSVPGWKFRKIRPASDEFTRQVRACKPIREKEHA